MLEDVIGFFKDVLGSSFRPLSDLCVSGLHKYKIDLLKQKIAKEKLEQQIKLSEDTFVPLEEIIK